jgi:hypothetical protein
MENQLDTARNPQFLKRPGDVILHGVLTQAQLAGDRLVRFASIRALHNL